LHVNTKDVAGREIAPGVVERTLIDALKTHLGTLRVNHYVLSEGGRMEYGASLTEYQHYIVQGCATQNHPDGSLLLQDTAWFVPCTAPWGGEPTRKHSICHSGEGEVRVLTIAYKVDRPAFRWAKMKTRNLYMVPQPHAGRRLVGYVQIFTEEEHALMGALRMHGLDIQTTPLGVSHLDHRNPEEVMYILRGKGIAFSDGESHEIGPGSMLYTPEGSIHGIRTVEEPIQYLVAEFIDHPKMWSERGLPGEA
jgi:mannose-6-phosphate isomerase-like protein (cupin superfamily)